MNNANSLVIKGGWVLDPANGTDGVRDVIVRHGKVAGVESHSESLPTATVLDASGKYVMPGHIDLHAHVSSAWDGPNRAVGHSMLAASGTTTILDLAGEPGRMAEGMKRSGAGLNVANLLGLIPHVTIKEDDPRPEVARATIAGALERGAIGIKLLGGYYPFTPEATSNVIAAANDLGAWAAFHVGSKDTGSHIDGLREVPAILGQGKLHVAHINSYCRGLIMTPAEECMEAIRVIEGIRHQVVTESYLAQINGSSGRCDEDGNVVYNAIQNCLLVRGYPATDVGLRQSMIDEYCSVLITDDDRNYLVTGKEAIKYWELGNTDVTVSFTVNPPSSSFTLATAKLSDKTFAVNTISTDGGALPRNVAIERTFALVTFGALTPLEAAYKLSYAPSRAVGLLAKGHLGEGADADFTIVDKATGLATMSLVAGKVIMKDGMAIGEGGKWLVTEEGEETAKGSGLPYEVIDLATSALYAGW